MPVARKVAVDMFAIVVLAFDNDNVRLEVVVVVVFDAVAGAVVVLDLVDISYYQLHPESLEHEVIHILKQSVNRNYLLEKI